MSMRDQAVQTAAFVAERAVQWIGHAIERSLDAEKFVAADLTPYKVILRKGLLSLRRYAPLQESEIQAGDEVLAVSTHRHRVPVLLVPPLGANPLNFDLLPNRSLVKVLLAHGHRVYLADFGDPQEDHSHFGLSDYATVMLPQALKKVRADSGEDQVTLMGYCMGGLFCLVYAGWSHDPNVRNIVTIASPIDTHQAGVAGKLFEVMNKPAELVRRYTGFRLHNIDPQHLTVPGWLASLAFKATNPMGTVQGYWDLLLNLWDREYVTQYQTMAKWFNQMHDYPGGVVQDFVVRAGLDNAFSKGEIRLGGKKKALLDRIECSLLAIAGTGDRIVTLDAARRVMDIVASGDKTFETAPGGHAGVFAGSRAPSTTWRIAAEWLASRSD